MESLDEIIKDKEQELTNITEEIVKIKDEWLPMLENLVGKINNNFSNYFSKMKCAGEVSLIQGEKLVCINMNMYNCSIYFIYLYLTDGF